MDGWSWRGVGNFIEAEHTQIATQNDVTSESFTSSESLISPVGDHLQTWKTRFIIFRSDEDP